MDNGFLAVLLLALAAVLIVAEVFLPSAGLLAAGMAISLAAAFYCAWMAWWPDNATLFFGFIAFALVFLPGVTIGALAWLPRTRFGKRIFLEAPTEAEVVPFAREQEILNSFVGRQAKTITPLNPGGMISIDRERIHAFSEGGVIDRDTPVEILKAVGTRVLVREIQIAEQAETQDQEPSDKKPADPFGIE